MERKHKITIPEPCHENWDEMTPNENGRFCMSCSKTVVDFTSMLPEEIQHFFIQNKNEKICGRFRKSQLDTISIQIPSQVLYTQTHYHKMFLLALFIVMGTTLFSCQDKDGNKKKIDQIEVVDDTDKNQDNKPKQIPPPLPPPEKKANQKNSEKLIKMVSGEVISENHATNNSKSKNKNTSLYSSTEKINCEKTSKKDSIVEEDNVFYMGAAIETTASYPNGIDNFYQLFIKEFKLSEETENLKNPIIVSFVIERDGSMSSFDFSKNTDPEIKAEVIRVLKIMPNWEPSTQNGKKTRTKYSMPIAFE
jgi:hypothetical protein